MKTLIALGLVAVAAAPVAALAAGVAGGGPCGDGGPCSYSLSTVAPGQKIINIDITHGNKPEVTIRDFSPKATTLTCDVAIPGYNAPLSFSFSNPGRTFLGGQGRGHSAQYPHVVFSAQGGGMVTDISQDSSSLLSDLPEGSYIQIGNCQANASISK